MPDLQTEPKQLPHSRRTGTAAFVLLAFASLAAATYSFSHAMSGEDHNEQMYVTAGVLVSEGKSIYRDFSYLQAPLQPFVYGAVFRLTGTTHRLFVARVVNWLTWALGACLVGHLVYRAGACRGVAVAWGLLYAMNPIMLRITVEASNYATPVTLALGQVALATAAGRSTGRRRSALHCLAGLMGGLAVGTKLYAVAVVVPYLAWPLFVATGGRPMRDVLWGVGGFTVALIPVAVLLSRPPAAFLFDNLQFHALTTQRYRETGASARMGASEKLHFVRTAVLTNVPLLSAAILGVVALAVAGIRRCRREAVAAALAGVGLLVACVMTPTWAQYLTLGVPFLLLAAGITVGAASLDDEGFRPKLSAAAWTVAAFSVVAALSPQPLIAMAQPHERWPPLLVQRAAAEVGTEVRGAGLTGKVATLSPLYAIEAGLPIYAEFATGPFLYSVADLIGEDLRRRVVGVGSESVGALFDADPPVAILTGAYGPTDPLFNEKALVLYAENNGYQLIRLKSRPELTLYLAPSVKSR